MQFFLFFDLLLYIYYPFIQFELFIDRREFSFYHLYSCKKCLIAYFEIYDLVVLRNIYDFLLFFIICLE
jgi:hypothetical protein